MSKYDFYYSNLTGFVQFILYKFKMYAIVKTIRKQHSHLKAFAEFAKYSVTPILSSHAKSRTLFGNRYEGVSKSFEPQAFSPFR